MNSSPPVFLSFNEVFIGVEPLLQKSPCLKKLSPPGLESHVRWFWNRGTMSWAQNAEGRFVGVCLIKLLSDLRDMDSFYVHDPSGQFIFIEEVVSDGPRTWQELFDQLYEVWGARDFVLWDRRERTEKSCPRIYFWSQYLKILKRLTRER